MPVYWKWLHRPKREGETEQDKILRTLSFKLPAVVRYNLAFALFFGILGAFYTKKMRTIMYFYRYTPLGITALCYEEVHRYYRWANGLPPLLPITPKADLTMAELIIQQAQ